MKHRLLKTHVWSILLYCYEAKIKPTLQAAEIWFYRRMLKIPSIVHETKDSVLQPVQQEGILPQIIEHQQKIFVRHYFCPISQTLTTLGHDTAPLKSLIFDYSLMDVSLTELQTTTKV